MTFDNAQMRLAQAFVHDTDRNIFLTGKAGTGKTTFLHRLTRECPKRLVVVAPTGVAAINAGGVTLHSFFQLAFGPYVPGNELQRQAEQRRFSREKINLIKCLDLLVIDEISMVRADTLDAVDAVLRRYRDRERPFGGVQLLMIGDLYQLAPIVKDDEWTLLQPHYDSCYFFSSRALQESAFISIELQHIYRQSDPDFIELLNRVRNNRLDAATLDALNRRCTGDCQPDDGADYITLSTHNRNADLINDQRLQQLPTPPSIFAAHIEGDFPPYSYPTAERLVLKKGAQVMFVRNDSSPDKRFFNGRIGRIVRVAKDAVTVRCQDDASEIKVEPVTWENVKYSLDERTKEITQEVTGRFTQYPLRLAWAITIHKSQGLTFERVIIDAQAAFSAGQVYVALSRCKSLEGIVLSSPVSPNAVKTNIDVARFVERAGNNPSTEEQLNDARIRYQQRLLLECFDFRRLSYSLRKLSGLLRDNARVLRYSGEEDLAAMERTTLDDTIGVAEKFRRQLQSLFVAGKVPEDDAILQERVRKACAYYSERLQAGLGAWLSGFQYDSDNKELNKQIEQACDYLRRNLAEKSAGLRSCCDGFATVVYLDAVARAAVEASRPARVKGDKAPLNAADMQHPGLYDALRNWRAERAAEQQVEHYRILHQRVLLQIAAALPRTTEALLRINGIGKRTVEKYGAQITALVSSYCEGQGLKEPLPEPPPEPQTEPVRKADTRAISYELYVQGQAIDEIAAARGLAASTIERHLAHYVRLGDLDINTLLPQEKIATIRQAIDVAGGSDDLKVIKDHLGDACSYGEIRLVLESLHETR